MPSMTLVLIPVEVLFIKRSKTWRPGVKLAVLAAVIERVISPFALPVIVDVIIVLDVE